MLHMQRVPVRPRPAAESLSFFFSCQQGLLSGRFVLRTMKKALCCTLIPRMTKGLISVIHIQFLLPHWSNLFLSLYGVHDIIPVTRLEL